MVEAVSLGKNYKDLIQNVQNALVLKLREEVIPAVELNEVARDGEAKAQAAVLPREPAVGLAESLEDVRQIVGRDPGS